MKQTEAHNCPNKSNHVSAWSAYDRVICPWCRKVYIRKELRRLNNERD